jgi:hypothetical protein
VGSFSQPLTSGRLLVCIVSGAIGLGVALDASSRPEKIRAGDSYYSDELAEPTHQAR